MYIIWYIILAVLIIIFISAKIVEGYESNIEIVVSRYNEDLQWLKKKKFKYPVTIYNKGDNDNFYKPKGCKILKLSNVGREGHTYLHHIIQNYDNLPELIIFLPGSANHNRKYNDVCKIMNSIKNNKITTFPIGENGDIKTIFNGFKLDKWSSTDINNKTANPENNLYPSNVRPFGKWYEKTLIKMLNIQDMVEYLQYQNFILNNTTKSIMKN